MLRQGHYMHISSLLILSPVNIICHLGFWIELHTLKNVLYKSLVAHAVDQMSAMQVFRLIIQSPCREFLPVAEHAKDHILCYPV